MRRTFVCCYPLIVVILGVVGACQPPVQVQVLTRPAPVPPSHTAATEGGPWSFRPRGVHADYTLEQRAQLVIQRDTIVRRDSVSSVAEVNFALYMPTLRVVGTVNAFRVTNSGGVAASPPGLSLPFPFVATFSGAGHQAAFLAPSAPPCATPALPVAQSLQDFWFEVPSSLRVGTIWEDSGSYVTCRDGVRMLASVRRTFRVAAATERDGHTSLTIVRLSRTLIEGEGAQAGEPVSITGSGSGELSYLLDLGVGEIVSALGTSTLELTMRSKLRTQLVRQSGEIRIARNR